VVLALFLVTGCGKKAGDRGAAPGSKTAPTTASTPRAAAAPDPRLADPTYLKQLPPSAQRDIAVGRAYLEQGNPDSAVVYFRQATVREGRNPGAWTFLGIALARLDRLDEAESAYKKSIEIDAFYPKTHSNLGNLYLKRNQFDAAILSYQRANSIDSTDVTNWLNLGLACLQKKDNSGAIIAYRKAADCDPALAEPWARLGNLYYSMFLYEGALESWGNAVARDSTREDLKDKIKKLQGYVDSTGSK
jgi:Flp pilus assembly protein TadD